MPPAGCPPNRLFWCSYAARQTAVKAKYHLWMTRTEKATISRVLARCPHQRLPTELLPMHRATRLPAESAAPTYAPTPSPTSHHEPSGPGCEPGYRPCLPIVDDLNCDDIDGALKPLHVTGDDPYRLDADGDHLGCIP
jgi:hypothetical protein